MLLTFFYILIILDKGKVDIFKKTGSEIGRQAATKSGGLFSAEDWQCTMYSENLDIFIIVFLGVVM